MKIAILGSGALGTITGALISKNGYNVDLIDEYAEHVKVLNESGATLTGFIDTTIPVHAVQPDELSELYDVVFLLTKQVYTKQALDTIMPYLHEDSIVCALQNGIPEELVASIVGKERTLGGAVGFGATFIKPGVSSLTTELAVMKKYAFEIGELDGALTNRLQTVKAILDSVGHCELTTNINGLKWTKLLMNTTFSGMSAALGCTFGEVLHNDTAMKVLANIADETIKVAKAHEIQLVKMQGEDLSELELESQREIPKKMPLYQKVWTPHVNLKASMLQDIEKGKQTEVDFINGVIVERGREVGIPTPFNEGVYRLIKQAEVERKKPEYTKSLEYFVEGILNENEYN